MPLSNPTTPERDLLAVTYDKVKEIRVVDTDDQSKVLAIENLAIAGTKVTVAVEGLPGTVDGAFEDVLTQIAGKADTTQVEALDAGKVDKTSVVQTIGASETDVMSQKAVTDKLALKADQTELDQLADEVNDKINALIEEFTAMKTKEILKSGTDVAYSTNQVIELAEVFTYVKLTNQGDDKIVFAVNESSMGASNPIELFAGETIEFAIEGTTLQFSSASDTLFSYVLLK